MSVSSLITPPCEGSNKAADYIRTGGTILAAALLLIGCGESTEQQQQSEPPILAIDFESVAPGSPAAQLISNPYLSLAPSHGVNGSTALRTKYQAYEMGSHRVVEAIPLPEHGLEYSLNFDVRFDENFQFVKGGKLHGLGPENRVTGGQPLHPAGWSSRIMFKDGGTLNTYNYHQDQKGKYGDRGKTDTSFVFKPGQYHAVSLHVKLNDNPQQGSGFSRVYIDGELVESQENVRFRGVDSPESEISRLLFSTFHGGNTPEWAPKDANGNFKDLYANFDNFAVYRGRHIRNSPGHI